MDELRSSGITYANASDVLLTQLPELLGRYEDLLTDWGDEVPGPHVVYGDVLNRHIDDLLQANDEAGLRRVFAFVEEIANSSDPRVREIVGATVVWYLGGSSEKLARVRQHMGSMTGRISDEVEDHYRRDREIGSPPERIKPRQSGAEFS